MDDSLRIGIIGDFDVGRVSQVKTNEAIVHASKELSIPIESVWLPTKSLTNHQNSKIMNFDGLWAGPGDYSCQIGALQVIKLCREKQLPFIGT